jgi:pyridoxamine 5'-phosphate oxidase
MEAGISSEAHAQEEGVRELNASDLDPDPVKQFGHWFTAALEAKLAEPNAMTLATATRQGIPSARIVLLKEYDQRGFVFFTNYESQKGRELAENPHVALVFFWPTLGRQVRLTGSATQVSREESEAYFHSRPAGSQLGAWASQQSQVLTDRDELDRRVGQLAMQYANAVIPLPPYWGGYRVPPVQIEFWQARVNRLHDRFRYRRGAAGEWIIERLSP